MKIIHTALAFLAITAFSSADDGKHLFILSGQSNMAGLNEKVSFVPTVEAEFGKEQVIVVKDAVGGRPIRDWYKNWKPASGGEAPATNGKLYDRLMAKVKPAIEGEKIATITFVWMQGERDAKENHGEVYCDSFKGLVSQIKTDLKRDDVNFVIGRLSDFDITNKKYKHWTMVREAQVKLAKDNKRGAWVDTDDLNGNKNGLHYNKPGYAELGKRFALEAIKLINN